MQRRAGALSAQRAQAVEDSGTAPRSKILNPLVPLGKDDAEMVGAYTKADTSHITVVYISEEVPGFSCLDWAVARVNGKLPSEEEFTDTPGYTANELAKTYFPGLKPCKDTDPNAVIALLGTSEKSKKADPEKGRVGHVQVKTGLGWESKMSTDPIAVVHRRDDFLPIFGVIHLCLKK